MKKKDTVLQHAGKEFRVGKGLLSAVEQSVTFAVDSQGDVPMYQRLSNTANNMELQSVLAALYGAQRAFVTNSGMAALHLVLTAVLRPGAHVLCLENCYGSTQGMLEKIFVPWGVEVEYCLAENFEKHCKSNTKVIITESISNPFCVPQDIRAICELGNRKGVVTIVDNTFASPHNCNPLALGATFVVESATKYLNGHSDQTAGVVASTKKNIDLLESKAMYVGCFLANESCVRVLRGLRTFELRMARHNANGVAFAEALSKNSCVEKVYYGPSAQARHLEERLLKDFQGFGGMVALRFSSRVDVPKLLKRLNLVADVPSLGGTETIACMPLHTTHKWTPAAECSRLGIDASVLRVSLGLEDPKDITADFEHALLEAQL